MNISLIGMMGAGKTTIGKLLSEELNGFSFVDIDSLIVKSEKCSINDIFFDKGEEYFREIESKTLKEVLNSDNQIISTGGGIILCDNNIKLLNEKSTTFYLNADENTLYNRVKNSKDRPLLADGDIKSKIHKLLNKRLQKYMQVQYIIDTNNKTADIIVKEIIGKLCINGKN